MTYLKDPTFLQNDWITIAAAVFNSISRILSSSSFKTIANLDTSLELIKVEHFDVYSYIGKSKKCIRILIASILDFKK